MYRNLFPIVRYKEGGNSEPGVVTQACDPSGRKTEAGGP